MVLMASQLGSLSKVSTNMIMRLMLSGWAKQAVLLYYSGVYTIMVISYFNIES